VRALLQEDRDKFTPDALQADKDVGIN